jgi:NAD(P)-dependent dehydrogenase (short-subunit alcohol dehydrogenase family)
VKLTVDRFGRLDGAVNCAGTERATGPLAERTLSEFAAAFDTNVRVVPDRPDRRRERRSNGVLSVGVRTAL